VARCSVGNELFIKLGGEALAVSKHNHQHTSFTNNGLLPSLFGEKAGDFSHLWELVGVKLPAPPESFG